MIGFAAPPGWLALVALAVPIAIHLIRRRAAREVPFAALEWLAARTPPRRQWRLDDRLLLAARLLLVALLAALLAAPFRRPQARPDATVVRVLPTVDAAAARAAFDAPLADWRWLADGDPGLDQPVAAADPQALASRVRALDRALPASTRLVLVVPDPLTGLDGERLRLGRDVVWRSVASRPAADRAAPSPPVLRVAIRADAAAATVARALVAAWRAAGQVVDLDEAAPGTPIAAGSALLIASGGTLDAATQARVVDGLNVLLGDPQALAGEVLLRDADGRPLLRRQTSGRGHIDTLAGPLDPAQWAALRDPQLPRRLLAWLAPAVPPPDQAPAASVAPLRAATDSPGPARPLAPWLGLAIALLWLIERALATRQRSDAA